MSASKRIAFAVAVTWLGRAISILSGLLLMPILFRFMPKEELGLWFLLGNSQMFLGLLTLGIAPTLSRHIALAKGKSGSDPSVALTEESRTHISDLVTTGRIILQWLAIGIFLVAWLCGYGFIQQLPLQEVSPDTLFWAWSFMCLGFAIGVWVSYLNCFLAGIGYVGWDSLISTGLALFTITANIVAVLLGGGLLALAIISVISGLANRVVILSFIRLRNPDLLTINGKWNRDYALRLVKPSLYSWLTDLGGFLLIRTDAYFIGLFRGTADIPNYQAAYSLVSNPHQLALPFGSSASTFISQAWQAGDLPLVHRIVLRNTQLALSIMAAGAAFVMVCGEEFMNLWLGPGNFIGYDVLLVFSIMLTLDAQQWVLTCSSRATEDERYAPLALTGGVLNVILTWLLIKPLGLLGVAMGTMISQMLTNNWYGVYRPMVRLKLNFWQYLRQVITLWALIAFTAYGSSYLVKQQLTQGGLVSDWYIVGTTAMVCGGIFLIACWAVILERHQRQSIQKQVLSLLQIKR